MTSFPLFVNHGQIAFFDSRIDKPFNAYTEPHLKQGFAWRPGSISFKTLLETGKMTVEFVHNPATYFPREDALRSISVPFSCPRHGKIEIATLTESHREQLKQGPNQIIFETGKTGDQYWARFTVITAGAQEPAILIRDAAITVAGPLWMKAQPAG